MSDLDKSKQGTDDDATHEGDEGPVKTAKALCAAALATTACEQYTTLEGCTTQGEECTSGDRCPLLPADPCAPAEVVCTTPEPCAALQAEIAAKLETKKKLGKKQKDFNTHLEQALSQHPSSRPLNRPQ